MTLEAAAINVRNGRSDVFRAGFAFRTRHRNRSVMDADGSAVRVRAVQMLACKTQSDVPFEMRCAEIGKTNSNSTIFKGQCLEIRCCEGGMTQPANWTAAGGAIARIRILAGKPRMLDVEGLRDSRHPV